VNGTNLFGTDAERLKKIKDKKRLGQNEGTPYVLNGGKGIVRKKILQQRAGVSSRTHGRRAASLFDCSRESERGKGIGKTHGVGAHCELS